jgi:hypothetical protein
MIFDIETTGLEKEKARITCISCYNEETNEITTFIDEKEKNIIENFFIHIFGEEVIYSFNGDLFDIPFIIYRAFKTEAKGPEGFKLPKHIDLRKIFHGFFYNYESIKYKKGSLNSIAIDFLGEKPKETNGLEVVKAWEDKNFKLIKEHCEYDVVLTYKLYKRCREIGLI